METMKKVKVMTMTTKFYHFSQNNSGGGFEYDAERGITHHVVIEAVSAGHADERAEQIGLYFDGCEDDRDCPCCGDRWYRASEYGADEVPKVYDRALEDGEPTKDHTHWMKGKYEAFLHPLNGKPVGYWSDTSEEK